MTDIRTLLREAAPQPLAPLDMVAVRALARRRSMRRFVTWVGGIGVVIAAAVPTGGSLLVNAAGGGRDHNGAKNEAQAVDAVDRGTTDRSLSAPLVGTDRAGDPAAAGIAPPGGPPEGGVTTTTDQRDAVAPASASDYPKRPSCVIDNVGLGDGEQRSCRFTATSDGGADLVSSGTVSPPPGAKAEVTVTRDGQTTTYSVHNQEQRAGGLNHAICGSFIEPGDLVEVVLTNSTNDPERATLTLGAGEGWECWNRT